MNEKKVRILAIIALVFWAVFTVSLILFFTDMNNTVYMLLTLSSGLIGLALYFVVRVRMKEKQYLVNEDGSKPSLPEGDDIEATEEECNGEKDDGKAENEQSADATGE